MWVADSLAALREAIASAGLHVVFVSQPACAICDALLPKVAEAVAHHPAATLAYVDAAVVPAVAAELSVLSAPTVLAYLNGREVLREGRFLRLDQFEAALARFAEAAG